MEKDSLVKEISNTEKKQLFNEVMEDLNYSFNPKDICLSVSKILKELIEDNKTSIKEIAEKTGRCSSYIENILEYDKNRKNCVLIPLEFIKKTADNYNIEINKFFQKREDNMYMTRIINHNGKFSDENDVKHIEEKLNSIYLDGYEVVSANLIDNTKLFVILKKREL